MSKFIITRRSDAEFQFNLIARNGEKILHSEGYTTRENCLNGIKSVKSHAHDDNNYEHKISINSKYYFILKAANGQVIGVSEMYETSVGKEKGIEAVKKNAGEADVLDRSQAN